MIRTEVFKVPDRDLHVLVTVYPDDQMTIAVRPVYGSWGPPIRSMSATRAQQEADGAARAAGTFARAMMQPVNTGEQKP